MSLSKDERDLLISVALIEKSVDIENIEEALGVRWSVKSLFEQEKESSAVEDYVRIPLLPAVAPDVFHSITESVKKKVKRKTQLGDSVDIGTLSVADAKKFFKNLNRG